MSCRKASTVSVITVGSRAKPASRVSHASANCLQCQSRSMPSRLSKPSPQHQKRKHITPLLRRPHAHHRALLARATAEAPPLAGFAKGRHLMKPTPVLDTHGNTHRLCWLLPTAPPLASPRRIVAQSQSKNTKSRRSKRPLL